MRKPAYSKQMESEFLQKLGTHYKDRDVLSHKEIMQYVATKRQKTPYFLFRNVDRKRGRGLFYIGQELTQSVGEVKKKKIVQPKMVNTTTPEVPDNVMDLRAKRATNLTESFVPDKDETYVSFGFFDDLEEIIADGIFFPVYITGLSGNGKTMMVDQVCAKLKRELIRVNITKRTDENDLIGSYELIDGNTIRREGPVITAMRRGAVLLLDETDLGTEDLLCLQPILEGKPYFDKKTGEIVHPKDGFNIIATGNTKGRGSDDGKFIGTNTLNEAFLERFAITEEQDFPPVAVETKILNKNFEKMGIQDTEFTECLVKWAEVIRKTYSEGAIDDIITTRRLVHITKAYRIFKKNRIKAIRKCLNRFDDEVKTQFIDLYSKIDASVTV